MEIERFTDETWSKYISKWLTYNKRWLRLRFNNVPSLFFLFFLLRPYFERCFCCWSFYQDLLFRFHCDGGAGACLSDKKRGRGKCSHPPTWDDTTLFTWSELSSLERWHSVNFPSHKLWGFLSSNAGCWEDEQGWCEYWRLAQSLLIDQKNRRLTQTNSWGVSSHDLVKLFLEGMIYFKYF